MSRTRIYQPVPLSANAVLCLDEKASHHLARVLRVVVGDELVIFNGSGEEYLASITRIDKKFVEVTLTQLQVNKTEAPIEIVLAQGIARGEKMDFIVQKAVELGVKQIVPLVTERCNVKLTNEREEKRLHHWQAVAVSACEQSGRHCPPQISTPISLKQWLPTASADLCFVLSPHVTQKLPEKTLPANARVILLIGPEGGLSDQEVSHAATSGFLPLNLGPRVLRTETASIAAISLLQYCYGDFK